MNKLFAIAFTCIYLLLTVGVVKTTHYCMGREKSTKLFTFESKKCGCALFAAEKEGCCDDKSELIKLQTEQQVAQSFSLAIPELAIIAPLHFELIELHQYEVGNFYETDFSPPPREPHYKRFCSFRFYDDEDVRA